MGRRLREKRLGYCQLWTAQNSIIDKKKINKNRLKKIKNKFFFKLTKMKFSVKLGWGRTAVGMEMSDQQVFL